MGTATKIVGELFWVVQFLCSWFKKKKDCQYLKLVVPSISTSCLRWHKTVSSELKNLMVQISVGGKC